MLAAQPGLNDLALTTNGILLAAQAEALRAAGLQRVTVSLDTLQAERMLAFARSARHADVLEGIGAAQAAGFERIKLNSVIIRGFNDDEVLPLLEFARAHDLELRFIEYMDVGGATRWRSEDVVARAELLELIGERFGSVEALSDAANPNAPAERFMLRDGTAFGIIASVTAPFCASCDRSRVTADGTWFTCLYAGRGIDLREPLRMGCTDSELERLITEAWQRRTDRGAEERLGVQGRGVLYQVEGLRQDPHREMHTRGG
jgi:cyclic pyranopterin phosphate synthase